MSHLYVLDGHKPVATEDVLAWGAWFETADRRVKYDEVSEDVQVSTVFLGLDQNFAMSETPVLFETMIFGGPHDGDQDRYSTWEEAEAGHAKMLAIARGEADGEDSEA